MRTSTLVALVCIFSCTVPALSEPFLPGPYQSADGALLMAPNGDYVEPYFATKALIAAQDAGLDVHDAAMAWIAWLLPRQREDGRFERYCYKPHHGWHPCGAADADDSMLSLWLQLLYRMAPDTGLPAEWQQSATKAEHQLDKLKNWRLGVYHVSSRNHVALFMDNIEVYAALKDVARAQARFGQQADAQKTEAEADHLARSIQSVFWDEKNGWYRSSIQKSRRGFYPDVVAQTYPWLSGMPTESDPRSGWATWRQRYAGAWLSNRYDPHPWGLVALTAAKVGDDESAVCWLSHSEHLRNGKYWNILEEAAYQGIQKTVAAQQSSKASACRNMVAGQ
jgi:hypothetical protein